MATWKERLAAEMPKELAREIDIFDTELALRKQGKLEEKLFAETRLRRGAYGQRYDNGQRHDGVASQTLAFPSGALTKGPQTLWDAPGMQRIKIPFGGLSARQLEVMADVAEEYSDGIAHITTRQDFQLHFVHIDDTPDMMRRLAAVGITTREACGNAVRNVTACQFAGVCATEPFDTTPYANALALFLLGHPDTQDFGRKLKIAFSGCRDEACGLVSIHDIGAIAVMKDGKRGFEFYVGGGLGAVPHHAKLLDPFVGEEELLPLAQAVCRVFTRLGERTNRARARLKFVVQKLGIEAFTAAVREERTKLAPDARWTSYLETLHATDEHALRPAALLRRKGTAQFEAWRATNVRAQRQAGYSVATISCPLGDLTSAQLRALADLSRRHCGDTVRLTIEQNLVFRWVADDDLPALHAELVPLGLGAPGAGTIVDVTACPGTDTCKLGISSSRGLAGELRTRLAEKAVTMDAAVRDLRIKVSGCFNACGQHHVADLGFLGVSRNVNGRRVPNFQVVLGGKWRENGGAYGLAIGAIPSKRIPEVVDRFTARYVADRQGEESFQSVIQRIGKLPLRKMIEDLIEVPAYAEATADVYRDWGDPREYTIGDMGVGECAGEVVPLVEFGLAAAEREVFESNVLLDDGKSDDAATRAYNAMLTAAKALARHVGAPVTDDAEDVLAKFRTFLVEPKLFWDPYAGDKFAHMLFKARAGGTTGLDAEKAHQRVEEAQLFVDASHQAYQRIAEARAQSAAGAAE